MKLLIQFIVFAICYCLNAYAAPFFKDLGFALGILVFGDRDGAAMMCGLLSGALAILVYGVGFAIAKRIRERRMDGALRNAPGTKRIIFGLLMLLVDVAFTGDLAMQPPYFGSGDLVVPVSGDQFLRDFLFLLAFHWIGVLSTISLVWGLIVFYRRSPAVFEFSGSQPPVPTGIKARFCKLCGDSIDPTTRKCTGCGKQYFRLPVFTGKHYFIAATAVACVLAAVLLVMLLSQRSTYETQIAELTARVSELEDELAKAEDEISAQSRIAETHKATIENQSKTLKASNETIKDLREENSDMRAEIRFYDNHVVFIGDDGTRKYHNYDCPYLDMSEGFYAYNTENAKAQGYKPCSHCCD